MKAVDRSGTTKALEQRHEMKASEAGLNNAVVQALSARLGITSLFPMQAEVVSHILGASGRDVVLCAPTGSGKTLAYCLPILSLLSSRIVPRLRAVIVVPTRDLASQVHGIFSALAGDLGIKIALAVGSSSVHREMASVCGAEVLVATPGRLLEHTKSTSGFSLSNVQFLVLDESDRLLQDSFYGWAETVIPACGARPTAETSAVPTGLAALGIHPIRKDLSGRGTRRKPRLILASATQTRNLKRLGLLDLYQPKMVVASSSGMVVCDPSTNELEVDLSMERYSVPNSLKEQAYVVSDPQEKPLVLLRLLGLGNGESSEIEGMNSKLDVLPLAGSRLIFTKSVEAAHRLARFLELSADQAEADVDVLEISGSLSSERRAFVLAKMDVARPAENGEVSKFCGCTIVVCSDVLARGMDISSVDAVINYDVPVHVNTYLHRVGRTARAGREGLAITILLSKQARHFKAMIRSIDRGEMKFRFRSLVWGDENFGSVLPRANVTLGSLKRVLRREQLGLLIAEHPLPSYALRELGEKNKDLDGSEFESGAHLRGTGPDGSLDEDGDAHVKEVNPRSKRFKANSADDENGNGLSADGDLDPYTLADDTGLGVGELGDSAAGPTAEDEFSDLIRAQVAKNFLGALARF
jgi:ATP-dependent RNA helicase DDX51/DBP6